MLNSVEEIGLIEMVVVDTSRHHKVKDFLVEKEHLKKPRE